MGKDLFHSNPKPTLPKIDFNKEMILGFLVVSIVQEDMILK